MRCRAWRTLPHGHAKAGTADIGAAARDQLAVLDQRIDDGRIEHRDVKSLAGFDFLFQVGIDLEMQLDRVAGGAFELRAQFPNRRLGAIAAQNPKLGGLRSRSCDKQCRNKYEQSSHGLTSFFAAIQPNRLVSPLTGRT